jgi:hypothetical protein
LRKQKIEEVIGLVRDLETLGSIERLMAPLRF